MTEDEQLEAIKKWWQKYNTPITVILSIVLLIMAGYKYWYWHQNKIKTQASNAYEQLMVAFSNENNKSIKAYANQLIQDYDDTVYADVAKLTLAKLFANKEQYGKAREMLNTVAQHSKIKSFRQLAKIRIARLLVAEKQYDKALAELTVIDDNSYMPVINELKGDIYAATGKYEQAITSYKEAITEVRTHGMGNLFLEMKTNEVAAVAQSTSVKNHQLQAA